jgi:hypothetical protein
MNKQINHESNSHSDDVYVTSVLTSGGRYRMVQRVGVSPVDISVQKISGRNRPSTRFELDGVEIPSDVSNFD